MPKFRMVCSTCGSENVLRDAWAQWSVEDQQWELSSTFYEAICGDCEGKTTIDEEPIEE